MPLNVYLPPLVNLQSQLIRATCLFNGYLLELATCRFLSQGLLHELVTSKV